MSWSLIQGVLPIVNRIDQETEKEARAHKGCRVIQEEEEEEEAALGLADLPSKGVLPTVYRIKKLKPRRRPNKGLYSYRYTVALITAAIVITVRYPHSHTETTAHCREQKLLDSYYSFIDRITNPEVGFIIQISGSAPGMYVKRMSHTGRKGLRKVLTGLFCTNLYYISFSNHT
jgi:hypothetical protein